MRRSVRWTLFASVVTALAMFLAACGGNDDSGGGGSSQSGLKEGTKIQQGKQGGALTILAAGDVDYIDPGQTYYQFGYQVAYAANRTLYAFKPDNSITAVPDIAEAEPEISSDNKTLTVKIKKGIKYAPPVNREVKAQDIKYAFERAFSKEVPNGYAGTYFNSIVGTPEKPNSADPKDISGIETPDDYTIVFKLKTASAPLISQALVMPITTPVPKEYAAQYDKSTPSKYNQYVAFVGPYMVKNDPKSGKLTGWTPGKQIQLVRNPNWDKATDFRPAYLDSITIQEGNQDLATATRRTFTGNAMVCCGDSASPPAPVLKQAVQRYKDQVFFVPSGGTRYIAFNTTVKPLDNINIRKAIIVATDRDALRLTRGGAILGDIANGWLPPDFPGFKEAGGVKQNTDLDFMAHPKGDPALFKKYMLAAKEEDPGLPIGADGKWTGSEKILTVADSADPSKTTAEVFQGQLEAMGFKLNFRTVPRDTMYTKFCSEPDSKTAICPSVGWFKDFSDPQSMLDATFNGKNILAHGNVNWPQLDVPAINNGMKEASAIPVGTERSTAYAKVNHMIAEQAAALPYIWDKSATVAAKNVQLVQNGYWAGTDVSYTSLK
jgi:peptide/nickel transport system substrate-binding protein